MLRLGLMGGLSGFEGDDAGAEGFEGGADEGVVFEFAFVQGFSGSGG